MGVIAKLMELIWLHLAAAILAIMLGITNLALEKGTLQHRTIGWSWLALMTFVIVSSFWIREMDEGGFSWIHLLTVWTIASMAVAVISIRKGCVRVHAFCMAGTMIGAVVAGIFALAPGRFMSAMLGYA